MKDYDARVSFEHQAVESASAPRFILVFGMARSGTSWIGKVFDSHPLTLYKHEPDRAMPGVPLVPRYEDAEQYRAAIRRFFVELPYLKSEQVAGSLPLFPKQYRSRIAQHTHRASVLLAKAVSSLGFRLPVLQCAPISRPDIRVVWKSIDSMGRLGAILRIMEDCCAIRITRHPCGSIASTLRGEVQHRFSSPVPASENYDAMRMLLEAAGRPRGLTIDHLRKFHPIERMAWKWVLTHEKVEDETRMIKRCIAVRYEDFCCDPVNRMQELFSFARLTWCGETSDFINASTLAAPPRKFDRLTRGPGDFYSVFKNPMRAANGWKEEMKPEDIDRVYRVLRQSDLIRLYPETEHVPFRATLQ